MCELSSSHLRRKSFIENMLETCSEFIEGGYPESRFSKY